MLSLWQASPPAGSVDAEVRDHAQHRRGVPSYQHQNALPAVPRRGHERSAWITRTPYTAVTGRNTGRAEKEEDNGTRQGR